MGAEQGYIPLTHDVNAMRGYYYERLNAGRPVPGVFFIHGTAPIGPVIESLTMILLASDESEWQGKIEYLPF